MSDAPFIISPAGFIMDLNWNPSGPQNGFANLSPGHNPNKTPSSGRGPGAVTPPLPGAVVQLVGTGEFPVVGQLNGPRGTIQANFVTGTAGPAQAIAMLIGDTAPITQFLGITIDSQNRPKFEITDSTGALIAYSTPSGAAVPSGTPFQISLSWDATGLFLSSYIFFMINNIPIATTIITMPSTGWSPFVPVAMLGSVGGYGSLNSFGGSLIKMQASNAVITESPIPHGHPLPDGALIHGDSAVTATLTSHLTLATTVVGAASVTTDLVIA